MATIEINKEKCTGCGVCGEICPYKAIEFKDRIAEYRAEDCFLCGHCQAVCPVDAVVIKDISRNMDFASFIELGAMVQPGEGDVAELVALMRSRRSCRKYRTKTIDLNILEDLVKIGTTAPSGTNSQPWRFHILPERDNVLVLGGLTADYYRKLNGQAENRFLRLLVRIFGGDSLGKYYRNYHASVQEALSEWDTEHIDRLFHGATATILVTGRRDASCPAEDALLATQNMLLAAHVMGLGSCLIGFVVEAMRRNSTIKEKLGIPEEEEVYSVIALGYPDVKYHGPAGRKELVSKVCKL